MATKTPLLHPQTERQLLAFLERPSHAILLTGSIGIGKSYVAQWLAASLLHVDSEKLSNSPNISFVTPDKTSGISVEVIRQVQKFLELKVVGKHHRIVLIDDAELLTEQAQNALLKTLEEPSNNTILILCTNNPTALLPTIHSRVQTIDIKRPASTTIEAHFREQGYESAAIAKAQLIAGGLPGLLTTLLANNQDHPLAQAAATAREILQGSTFDRLAMVDSLSKQKDHMLRTLDVLQQMAHVALGMANTAPARQKTWQDVLEASYEASTALRRNAQAKLVLTNLMLNL